MPCSLPAAPLRLRCLVLIPILLLLSSTGLAGEITSQVQGESIVAESPLEASSYIQYGQFLIAQRAYSQAADVLERGRVKAPASAELLVLLGRSYQEQELMARAEAVTREALKVDPHNVEALVRMGEISFRLGWNKSGLDNFREAVALAPQNDLPKVRLVGGLCQDEQLDAAEDQCLEFIATNAQSPDLWLSLGQVFESQDKRRQAFTTYGQVLTIDPENSQAYARQGRLFCEFGQFSAAESACRRAVELDPENALGHAYLGIAYSRLGQGDEARIHARIAEESGLDMVSVWKIIGD